MSPLSFILQCLIPVALASTTPVEPPPFPVEHAERVKVVRSLIEEAGTRYEASETEKRQAWNIVRCENRELDPGAQSRVMHGTKREDSWGLAQIHLPAHPEVSKEQATDPEFAIDFLVKNVSEGKAYMWTCSGK